MMTEKDTQANDAALVPFFRAMRAEPLPSGPSDALMARILADAGRESGLHRGAPLPQRTAWQAPAVLRGLFEVLGGWPATAGLAATVVAGVWIGYSPPLPVADWIGTADLIDTYSSPAAFLAGYDAFLVEG